MHRPRGAQRHNPLVSKARHPTLGAQATPAGRLDEGPLRNVFGYQLAQASVVTDQVFRQQVSAPLGLRKVELTMLALVAHNEGPTAAQLAQALAFTAPNTAAWIERLVARGLVSREQHASDGRALHIRTTPAGRVLLQQALQVIAEGEDQALSRLSPGERLLLLELLHKAAGGRLPKR